MKKRWLFNNEHLIGKRLEKKFVSKDFIFMKFSIVSPIFNAFDRSKQTRIMNKIYSCIHLDLASKWSISISIIRDFNNYYSILLFYSWIISFHISVLTRVTKHSTTQHSKFIWFICPWCKSTSAPCRNINLKIYSIPF